MPRERVAVITGVTGQDGAYLTNFLIRKGYTVVGTRRQRNDRGNCWRLEKLDVLHHPCFELVDCELTDPRAWADLLTTWRPDEIYHLAAHTDVRSSFNLPITVGTVTGLGPVYLLEAIRYVNPDIRFLQASSSEMFGSATPPQNEDTPFLPRSPYGAAKLYAHWMTTNYREAHGLFAVNAIMFNHESPLRGEAFVTRKIAQAVARIHQGRKNTPLMLGNLEARRDWGFAGEYVEGMWRILQQDSPDDYVLATGETMTVRQFVEMAFETVGRTIRWAGHGENESGFDARTGARLVGINPTLYRPTEVNVLQGDPRKAKDALGWSARTYGRELCEMMIKAELER